jgi:8-oxo-dGTP diphosphatase
VRTCAGALLVRDRKILLAKRADDRPFYPGVWDIIGGHSEPNETPVDTLTRELREEIGITPRIFEQIAVLPEPRPAEYGDARYHVFVVRAWDGGEPRLMDAEHSKLHWMSVADALAMPVAHPAYRELFAKVLASA